MKKFKVCIYFVEEWEVEAENRDEALEHYDEGVCTSCCSRAEDDSLDYVEEIETYEDNEEDDDE